MATDSSFHDYIVYDVLGDMPNVTSKAMFGGWALYKAGRIFGIIVGGEMYFKVGDGNRDTFENIASRPFVYSKKDGTQVTMSYRLVPEEIIEDGQRLARFVEEAVAAGRPALTPDSPEAG